MQALFYDKQKRGVKYIVIKQYPLIYCGLILIIKYKSKMKQKIHKAKAIFDIYKT